VPLASTETDSTVLAPVYIEDGQQRALDGTIKLYAFADKVNLSGEKDITLESGLTVHTIAASFTPGATSATPDPYLAGVRVDPGESALPFDGITGTVLAMWYLGNYDGHISPAWAFTLSDTLGLTEGQSVEVYAANYEEATWTPAGTATVNGGVLVSSEGGGIPLLTTLIFVAP
jgi:hypothetical protein